MSKIAVIYKSKYGTTRQYAQWIAEAVGAVVLEASAVKPASLASFDVVIFGGAIYAGGITGIGLVTKNPCKQLVVFTVGVTNPKTADYTETLKKSFTAEQLSKTKLFHLQGGIDYFKLSFIHKAIIGMVRKSILKKEESKRSEQ